MTRDVAVLGAGLIGLLTARRLQQLGHKVFIYSENDSTATTSAAAGCIILPFFPFPPDSAEFSRRMDWMRSSLATYQEFMGGKHVSRVDHAEFCKDGYLEGSFSVDWLPHAHLDEMRLVELRQPFDGYQQYVRFRLPCINSVGFLEDLFSQVVSDGAHFRREHLTPNRLGDLPFDDIFNCLGYGSKEVFGDQELMPVFGQALRFPPISRHFGIGIGDFIALSTSYGLYIGSLFVEGESSALPRRIHYSRLSRFFRRELIHLLPIVGITADLCSLNDVRQTVAGVRPFRRSGVRLEVETLNGKLVVHNYGHGGHGWTLGWGSVMSAVGLWQDSRAGA